MASGRLLLFLCAFVVIAAAAPNATLLVLSTKYFSSPERKPGALHELDLSSGAVTRSTLATATTGMFLFGTCLLYFKFTKASEGPGGGYLLFQAAR